MKKRLLSLLLAASMLLSLMPTLTVGAAEETASDGFKFVYSFNLDGSQDTLLKTLDYAYTHNMWTLSSQSTNNMYNKAETNTSFGIQSGASPYAGNENEWLVFNLNVPFTGNYAVSLIRGMSNTGGGYGNVWLFRPGTEITAELLAETAPMNTEEIPYYVHASAATKQCSPMTLSESFEIDESGEWLIVFKPTRNGLGLDGKGEEDPEDTDDVEGSHMYIHSVTLTAADNPAVTQIVPQSTSLEMSEGAYKTVYITTYLSDNSVAGDGDCDITFESSDESVAKVSELGLVSGVGAGSAKIKITARKGISIAEAEVDVTVLGDAADANVLSSVEIEVNDGYASIKSAKMANGEDADLTNAKITYGVENLGIAGIDEATGEIIPGNTAGTATVYATVILDGVSVTGKTEAAVTPSTAPASGVKREYNFTTYKSGWEDLNTHADLVDIRRITKEFTDGNWEWVDWTASNTNANALIYLKKGAVRFVVGAGKYVALRLNIPETGLYWAELKSLKNKGANGASDVFIFHEDDVTDTKNDGTDKADITLYLNSATAHYNVDFVDASLAGETMIDEAMPKIALKAGSNILVFKASRASQLWPAVLTLDGTNALRTVNLNLERETIDFGKGESESASEVSARLRDGTLVEKADLTLTYGSDNEDVATFKDGTVTAVGCGTTEIFVKAEYNGTAVTSRKTITVTDTGGVKNLHVSAGDGVAYAGEKLLLSAYAEMNSGKAMPLDNGEIEFEIVEGAGRFLAGGYVTNSGDISEAITVKVIARTSVLGEVCESAPIELVFNPSTFKEAPTYYTYERRAAVEENIKKYTWARDELELYKSYCEDYLGGFDALYNAIIGEGIPRSNRVGEFTDNTNYAFCRYCGENIAGKYTASPYTRQWKVQCPECKRLFPSNNFEGFLKLGIEEDGTFNREKALVANGKLCGTIAEDGTILDEENPYGYGISKGFLYNETYSELRTEGNTLYNTDPRTGEAADGNVWGVDDGMGYRPDGMYNNSNVSSRHTYVAYYLHSALIEVHRAIKWLSTVYAYTGDEEYGVKGAILLDRLVDVYPTFHFKQWYNDDYKYSVSHGGSGFGKIFGNINDCEYVLNCIRAADALYPLLTEENSALISALSSKANEYGYINRNEDGSINEKKSGSEIWHSWENKLLREAFKAAETLELDGNYGQTQKAVASAALVLDSEPESKQMIEWVYRYGVETTSGDTAVSTGGLLSSKLVDDVDRDGMGYEAAPGYNIGWITDLYDTAEVLALYGNPDYNLYDNAKFAKMFSAGIPVALVDTHTAQIGDTEATANIGFSTDMQVMVNGFKELKDTTLGNELAEYIYRTNGYSVEGLHYDIYSADSESVQQDILARIDDDPSAPSEMMAGYGFAVLRDGGAYGDVGTPTYTNNKRDFWIYFGRNASSHGHFDTLNLGIEAFGLNFAPDNGTPEQKTNNRPRYQWTRPTLSHNTVNVNAYRQSDSGFHGYPKHFDDSGDVKLMDIDAPQVYADASIYRRTLVMINAGPDTSYGVDFFRIKGGNEHIYSFHAQSDTAELDGVDADKVVPQTDEATGEYVGSYEGRNVEWDVRMDYDDRTTQFENIGKSMLGEVRRAGEDALLGDTFAVDFKITDFNKVLKSGSQGLRLRMTMLNDDTENVTTEVALAKGKNTGNASNTKIPDFEYALIKREGENLDSLYTSVYEPYRNTRVLSEMKEVTIAPSAGSTASEGADDTARAVKVTRADKRVDYVTYATNNNVLYTVTDGDVSFDFRGFVGVYSLNEDGGEVIYRYVNDGDIIGNENDGSTNEETLSGNTAEPFAYKGYSGTVADYTKGDPSLSNFITISTDDVIDAEALAGKHVYISNDGVQNAVYEIKGAEAVDGGYKLDIGSVTTVRSYVDASDVSLGYVYNIQSGQNAYIPISNVEDYKPKFTATDTTVSAGSSLTIALSAIPDGNAESITYIGTTLPRGASLDTATGKFTWKPDSSQIGNHNVAVTARDEYGRETTAHFTVTVYGSTTSKPSDTTDNSGTSGEGTSSGGGGGGTAGQEATDTNPEGSAADNTGNDDETDNGEQTDGENAPDASGETDDIRFTDIQNHSWAADAINALASDGVIRGTTATTFSPAANITRADFALLLVRAFDLSSDNTENFADVNASDYFAPELAIARNTGIVNGIGDNKYAPRNTITRQDMMVIVYRALQASLALKGGGPSNDGGGIQAPAEYPDFNTVAPYARDAVSALISVGLVHGKSGRIAPADYTTRAEVAVLIKRIMDYLK